MVDEVPLICPAYAGVILPFLKSECFTQYLSRVCGGDPPPDPLCDTKLEFVPRMRG